MKIAFKNSLKNKIKRRIQSFEFEVGVLDEGIHKEPLDKSIATYAGGPVRKKSRVNSELTIGEILVKNMERTGINFLLEPFRDKTTELNRFTDAFLKMAISQKMSIKRVENLLQAVVRNPILKEEYGNNKGTTADNKGFDRHLFDTGQMFKAIKAKAKRV